MLIFRVCCLFCFVDFAVNVLMVFIYVGVYRVFVHGYLIVSFHNIWHSVIVVEAELRFPLCVCFCMGSREVWWVFNMRSWYNYRQSVSLQSSYSLFLVFM